MSVVGIDHSKFSSSSSRDWLTMMLIVNITINYGKTRREGKIKKVEDVLRKT